LQWGVGRDIPFDSKDYSNFHAFEMIEAGGSAFFGMVVWMLIWSGSVSGNGYPEGETPRWQQADKSNY
jgi:hypothetical protein